MPEITKPAPLYSQCLKAFVEIQVAQESLAAGDPDTTRQKLQGVRSTLEDVLFALAETGYVGLN
jgi:hypothetical protein